MSKSNLDFAYENAVRKACEKLLASPCDTCGKPFTRSDLAVATELDKAGLWRFLSTPETTMMPSNLRKLADFLESRGFPVPVKQPSVTQQAKGK